MLVKKSIQISEVNLFAFIYRIVSWRLFSNRPQTHRWLYSTMHMLQANLKWMSCKLLYWNTGEQLGETNDHIYSK